MKYILIGLLLITGSCICQKQKLSEESQSSANDLQLIMSDTYGGEEEESLQVIRKESELRAFFAQVNKTRKPGLPLPEIDFSRQLVIVYHSGEATAGEIRELYKDQQKDNEVVLGRREAKEQAAASSATARIQPFSLYTLPVTDKEVILEQPDKE